MLMERVVLNSMTCIEFAAVQLRPAVLKYYLRFRLAAVDYAGSTVTARVYLLGVMVRGIILGAVKRLNRFGNDL